MSASIAEQSLIEQLAAEYAKQGFTAFVSPSDALLPDFLQGMSVDLLLRSATENVVVQVKSSSTGLLDQGLARLTAVLDGRPDWRLELMLVPESERTRRGASLPVDIALARLRESSLLAETGHVAAALLIGWSAAEAVFRSLIKSPDPKDSYVSTQSLVTQLYSLGYLSDADHLLMRKIAESRNAVAHGFSPSAPGIDDLRAFISLVTTLSSSIEVE